MKVKFTFIFISLITLLLSCSCSVKENGSTLYAFINRMNTRCEDYEITVQGFTHNEAQKSFTKFFTFNEKEIMLKLIYGNDDSIHTLHIVFDSLEDSDSQELQFIKNSVYSFIDNDNTSSELLSLADFDNAVFLKDIKTKETTIGNTSLLLDVTDKYTVISIVQNIP